MEDHFSRVAKIAQGNLYYAPPVRPHDTRRSKPTNAGRQNNRYLAPTGSIELFETSYV